MTDERLREVCLKILETLRSFVWSDYEIAEMIEELEQVKAEGEKG